MACSSLVLDANILIRAILGKKVKKLMLNNIESVTFLTPDVCIRDAEKYLPVIFAKRNLPVQPGLEAFADLKYVLQIVDELFYNNYEIEAKKRMKNRDLFDWPIVATSLTFNCPLWTEDQDFFGSGLSVWTTDRIHLFFDSIK